MKMLGLVMFLVILVACGKQGTNAPQAAVHAASSRISAKMAEVAEGGAEQSLTQISEPQSDTSNGAMRKYIAMRHHLTIETPAEKMQASFDAAVKHCEVLNCQMISATFNRETPYSPPSASLSVRVPPRNINLFLSGLAQHGEVLSHSRDSEDKTNQVVDADAHIKNLTDLRDRLRGMLSDKTAKFKDIIEVERELANTQSELDSIVSLRKILSQETDMVAVNIDFSATQGITEQGFFAPVAHALKDAGRVMMESFATVITFMMNAIPWLLIGVPLMLLVRKYWARIKAKML